MKAQVLLISLLILFQYVSAHSISRRSLLRGSSRGHSHHNQSPRRGQNRRRNQRRFGTRRAGRDGDNHHHHDEVRAPSTGYLPAEDDYQYEDDTRSLPGYRGSDSQESEASLPGYTSDNTTPDTRDYDNYDYDNTSESPDYAGDEGSGSGDVADDEYAAPSDVDNSYAAPGEVEYSAPGEGYGGPEDNDTAGVDVARRADTDYSPPGADLDQAASQAQSQYDTQNGFPFEAVEGRRRSGSGSRSTGRGRGGADGRPKQCPGGSIEECVSVCPGYSTRVYGACVGGCADRCPETRRHA